MSLAQDEKGAQMQTVSAHFGFQRLVVRDLEKQAKFYGEAFGYGAGKRIHGEIKGRPIDEVIFTGKDGKVDFIVLAFPDAEDGPRPGVTLSAFFTPDLAALESRILAAGGSVYAASRPMKQSTGMARTAFYVDPEGNVFQVIQE